MRMCKKCHVFIRVWSVKEFNKNICHSEPIQSSLLKIKN